MMQSAATMQVDVAATPLGYPCHHRPSSSTPPPLPQSLQSSSSTVVTSPPSSPLPPSSSSSSPDALRRLACALNDVGALLARIGNSHGALERYQEAVQVRMDALRRAKGGMEVDDDATHTANTSREESEAEAAAEVRRRSALAEADELRRIGNNAAAAAGGGHSLLYDDDGPSVDMFRARSVGENSSHEREGEEGAAAAAAAAEDGSSPDAFAFYVRSDPVEIGSSAMGAAGTGTVGDDFDSGSGNGGCGSSDAAESAVTLYNMGLVHLRHGSLSMADRLFAMSLQVGTGYCPRTLTAEVQFNVALVRYRSGEPDEAMASLGENLRLLKGANQDLQDRRAALERQRQQRRAAALYGGYDHHHQQQQQQQRLFEQQQQRLDADDRAVQLAVADSLSLMSRIQHSFGSNDRALNLSREALRIRRAALGDDSPAVAETLYNIGLCLHAQGHVEDAIEHCAYFVKAFEVGGNSSSRSLSEQQGTNARYSRHVAEALHALGMMHRENGSVSLAVEALRKSIEHRRAFAVFRQRQQAGREGRDPQEQGALQAQQQHDPAIVETLMALGRIMQDSGQYDHALHSYRDALDVVTSLLNHDPEEIRTNESYATILCSIGQTQHAKGELDGAVESYSEVLDIARRLFGEADEFVASMHNALGNVHLELGDTQDAVRSFARAARILSGGNDDDAAGSDGGRGVTVVPNVGQCMGLDIHPHAAAA